MASKAVKELAEEIHKFIFIGTYIETPHHLQVIARLIQEKVGPLVEILNEAHEALGDYRYHGFNIRIEVLIAEWAEDGKKP